MEIETRAKEQAGPKIFVCVENLEFPWDRPTITVPEIRKLGNLPADLPVIEVLPDGTERTLTEDAVIELKPGHRFGKKVCFKRG